MRGTTPGRPPGRPLRARRRCRPGPLRIPARVVVDLEALQQAVARVLVDRYLIGDADPVGPLELLHVEDLGVHFGRVVDDDQHLGLRIEVGAGRLRMSSSSRRCESAMRAAYPFPEPVTKRRRAQFAGERCAGRRVPPARVGEAPCPGRRGPLPGSARPPARVDDAGPDCVRRPVRYPLGCVD